MNVIGLLDYRGDDTYHRIVSEQDRATVLDQVFNFSEKRGVCICGCGKAIHYRGLGDHPKLSLWGQAYFFHSPQCYRRTQKVLKAVQRGGGLKHELRRRLATHILM